MSKTNQRYIVGLYQPRSYRLYVKDLKSSQSAWITKNSLKSFVSKLNLKILELIHQNSSIQLKKQEVIQDLMKQAIQWKFSARTPEMLNRRQKSIIQNKQHQNSHQLFKYLKINIMTPQFWKSCYHLVKQPQLFQILGKKNSQENTNCFYYLIKYKYFTDPETFLKGTCNQFQDHPLCKFLKRQEIQICQDQSMKKITNFLNLKQKFLSNQSCKRKNRRLIVIGTAVIFQHKFCLVKFSNEILQNFQWKTTALFKISSQRIKKHKFQSQPIFYRDKIKKHIIEELRQSKNISNQKTQNVVKMDDHFLDQIVEEKIKFYVKKLQRLKKAIEIYYEGLKIFEPDSNSIKISSLRQKMFKIQDDFLKEQSEFVAKDQSKKQYQSEDGYQNGLDYEIDKFQKLQQSFYSEEEVKFQNEFEQTRSGSGSYSSQNSADFFQKVKNQCKQQGQQDQWLKSKNHKSSRKNRLSCKKSNTKSKAQIKRQKIQEKNFQDNVKVEIDVDQIFNQSLKNQSRKSEIQLKETKKQQIHLKKVKQITKLKSVKNEDIFYNVEYQDGSLVLCRNLKQLQKLGISQDLIKNAQLQ